MSDMILAFETSTDVCSVAFQNAEGEIFEKRIQGRSVHSSHVFLFSGELMKEHNFQVTDLDAVLVSNGPGSYTGLRIAVSAIKGMLFETDVKVVAVNTLAGFAGGLLDYDEQHQIHAIIDARRTHLYHQIFWCENGKLYTRTTPEVKEIRAVEKQLRFHDALIGTGSLRISPESLQNMRVFGSDNISAKNLIRIYNNQPEAPFLMEVSKEALDPDYINNSQVNNNASQANPQKNNEKDN